MDAQLMDHFRPDFECREAAAPYSMLKHTRRSLQPNYCCRAIEHGQEFIRIG
jgi:hypothetical protein